VTPLPQGDADIAAVGKLLGDPARCLILVALQDGRAPASMLADEAGIAATTASSHLGKLTRAGFLDVEQHGRHRYYRLSGGRISDLLELMAGLAPAKPIRSLREGTKAHALRTARSCYDHLAGKLGVTLMRRMLDEAWITGGDGRFDPRQVSGDHLAGSGRDVDYRLTAAGHERLASFGVAIPEPVPALRYCIDWTEQQHHLSGVVGRAVLARLSDLDWVRRANTGRAVVVTDAGQAGLSETFAMSWPLAA
jgi:DNA-binding transcriptional ArsR family regulator